MTAMEHQQHRCHQCGGKLIEGDSFCANCGAAVTIAEQPVAEAQPTSASTPSQNNRFRRFSAALVFLIAVVIGAASWIKFGADNSASADPSPQPEAAAAVNPQQEKPTIRVEL